MVSTAMLASVTLLVITAACAASDYLTGRIPNSLILCALLCAVISRLVGFTVPPSWQQFPGVGLLLGDMASGFLLPILFLGILTQLRMLGGGDVKLLSAIGLQTGLRGSLTIVWYSLLASAAEAVLIVLRRRNLEERLRYLGRYAGAVRSAGRALPYRSLPTRDGKSASEGGEFAFGVPVFLALCFYLIR